MKSHVRLQVRLGGMVVALLVAASLMMSGCVLATVRTLDEDEEAKAGFDPVAYVDNMWEERVIPTYEEEAVELSLLLDELRANEEAAIEQYGHRSGTGSYSFMVRGEGTIITFDTSSRAGLATVDLAPEDGVAEASLTIGPLIKISQRAAVRDALGFIEYGNFVNQQEFAAVANAMGERITAMIAGELGAAEVDAVRELDPETVVGQPVFFIGAFTYDDLDNVLVVPVIFEVGE